jgi:SAM-dependent methyltransferase
MGLLYEKLCWMNNPYNVVRYPTYAKPQTHPDHLATLATVFGLSPAPACRCRVLDIGCGTGGNLIAMAQGLPESEFVGIDLAGEPIAEGQKIIAALGLRNIELRAMDVLDFGPEFGVFDYIIAFGVFTWVPDFVRQKMLAIAASQLSPHGVAFFSYNTYPGFHMRAMLSDMLRYQIAGVEDPEQAVKQAFWLMKFLMDAEPAGDTYEACVRQEVQKAMSRPPGGLFHDELAGGTTAFYFHEVAAMAREHGLQYLAEAEFFMMQDHLRGDKIASALRPFAGDVIRKEQYLDFVRGRRFRQTLFCREGLPVEREVNPERMRRLLFSCPAHADAEGRYRRATGVPIRPVHPLATGALEHLASCYPRRMSFPELAGACGCSGEDSAGLCEILLGCYAAGILDAHMHAPNFAAEAGPRPVISPLARLQFAEEDVAVNLCHTLVRLPDETCRRMTQLLDGSHDPAGLAQELGVTEGKVGECLRDLAALALLSG